jgi:hypothetical protein
MDCPLRKVEYYDITQYREKGGDRNMRLTIAEQALKEAARRGYYSTDNTVVSFTGKERTLQISKNGYLYFQIGMRITRKTQIVKIFVHRLVAYLKYGNRMFKKDIIVRHANDFKGNNFWYNILIGTCKDNMRDAKRNARI